MRVRSYYFLHFCLTSTVQQPVPRLLDLRRGTGGCGKRGHTVEDCWGDLDAAKAKIDLAMAKRDKKREEIEKRKPSAKEARANTAACNKASAAGEAAEESDYSCVSMHVILLPHRTYVVHAWYITART